ncbi:ribose-phosphate pyrophosphokinase [Candidatus Uhrbacteria bacterium]|nr:ribose-phosphate pyrophosphokinase [Candidatus Uhrbacteria bacterium]
MKEAILFSGSSNPHLARGIARELRIPFGEMTLKTFRDGETYVNIDRPIHPRVGIRGKQVLIVQSGAPHGNTMFMELLLMIDAVHRHDPRSITVVLPFYPYRRQERRVETGEAVSAAVVARCLEAMNVARVVLTELHVDKVRDFFSVPLVDVRTEPLFGAYFEKILARRRQRRKGKFVWHGDPWVVVAPDLGSRPAARALADQLMVSFVQSYKHRHMHDVVDVDAMSGAVAGKNAIILDDEIDTAGTMVENARYLRKHGARDIYVAATHGVFAGSALKQLDHHHFIREVVVTDTIAIPDADRIAKLKILSVAPLLATALKKLKK